jgi:hypothetical protein
MGRPPRKEVDKRDPFAKEGVMPHSSYVWHSDGQRLT